MVDRRRDSGKKIILPDGLPGARGATVSPPRESDVSCKACGIFHAVNASSRMDPGNRLALSDPAVGACAEESWIAVSHFGRSRS